MSPRSLPRALLIAALSGPIVLAAASPRHAFAQGAPAQSDPYKQHMDNGVKLYNDRNYEAALSEFRAAYNARPKASPLVNIALCHKALFNYPKAIVALEQALDRHGELMEEGDKKAAGEAIREMKALLGHVTVRVSPKEAALFVDGEEQPAQARDAPIPLGPGAHKIVARADGFASAERSVTISSGDSTQVIELDLVADKGWVTVQTGDAQMTIAIDQRPVGQGSWSGFLAPGSHLVQMYGPGGKPYSAQQILVVAGKPSNVRAGGGLPVEPGQPPKQDKPKEDPDPPQKRGIYFLGTASLLFPTQHPPNFPRPEVNGGGAGGLRFGYRVNTPAAFEFVFDYSSLYTSSQDARYPDTSYTLSSARFGLGLRLMTPGKLIRAIGTIAGGVVHDRVNFKEASSLCEKCKASSGFDPFLLAEAGAELDLSNVLIGISFQAIFQSSRGIDGSTDTDEPFGSKPLVHVGPSLRIGYAFW